MQADTPSKDKHWMKRALALARRGQSSVRPNPKVGAVIVKDGRCISHGVHRKAGGPHAEIEALRSARSDVSGATLYVTLEPCNHHGKTPPCTDAIVEAKLHRVVVAMRDPNPKVAGHGIERLEKAGIQVDVGLLAGEASQLNAAWIHAISTGEPYVSAFLPLSIEGIYAENPVDFFPLSAVARNHAERRLAHADCLILDERKFCSTWVSLSEWLKRTPFPSAVFVVRDQTDFPDALRSFLLQFREITTIVVVQAVSLSPKARKLVPRGLEIVEASGSGGLDWRQLSSELGKRSIQAPCICGGSVLLESAFYASVCRRLMVYRLPVFLGKTGKDIFSECAVELRYSFKLIHCQKIGREAFTDYDVQYKS